MTRDELIRRLAEFAGQATAEHADRLLPRDRREFTEQDVRDLYLRMGHRRSRVVRFAEEHVILAAVATFLVVPLFVLVFWFLGERGPLRKLWDWDWSWKPESKRTYYEGSYHEPARAEPADLCP
jgi:hypothetical protein